MKMYKRFILITFLILIFILQVIPVAASSEVSNLDKVVHFFIYFFLTFLFFWSGFSLKKSIVFAISYGILMEIVQIPLSYRDFSFYDFLANCLGSFSFRGVYWLKVKRYG